MNEHIRLHDVWADGDGTLHRQVEGYFDMSEAPDSDNLRRLAVIQATRELEHIEARWSGSVNWATKTEKSFFPPQYFGDRIIIDWWRPFSEPEDIAAVEGESLKALEAAVDAILAAGYEILPDPIRRARQVK